MLSTLCCRAVPNVQGRLISKISGTKRALLVPERFWLSLLFITCCQDLVNHAILNLVGSLHRGRIKVNKTPGV